MHTKKYLAGLTIAVIVLLINQLYIQYQIQSISEDAYIINIAGKQRMLSQRISLEFHKIVSNNASNTVLKELYQ